MRRAALTWAGVWVVLSACVTTAGSASLVRRELAVALPATPASFWKTVDAPGYTLLTDLPDDQAAEAALLLSQSLAGLNAMFARAPRVSEQQLTIIAMRDGLDFEARFGKRTWGFAASNDAGTTLVLYGPPQRWFTRSEANYEATESVVQHELAHAVLRRYFRDQPKWFAEGMAQYLETYRWTDEGTLVLGDPNLAAYRAYRAIRSLGVDDLLTWADLSGGELDVAGRYGLSWAFVHYARNERPQDLGRYMATLANQGNDAAWKATFAMHRGSLDQDIFRYMKVGQYRQIVLKVPLAPPVAVAIRPATDEETHAIKSRLSTLEVLMKAP